MFRHVACYGLLVVAVFALDPAVEPATADQATVGQSGQSIAWPPKHMQKLPADYLERLHASLVAGTSRMGRLHFDTTKSSDSIG